MNGPSRRKYGLARACRYGILEGPADAGRFRVSSGDLRELSFAMSEETRASGRRDFGRRYRSPGLNTPTNRLVKEIL